MITCGADQGISRLRITSDHSIDIEDLTLAGVLWIYGARCLSVGHGIYHRGGLMVPAVCLWAI